jgi:hypothetical protein
MFLSLPRKITGPLFEDPSLKNISKNLLRAVRRVVTKDKRKVVYSLRRAVGVAEALSQPDLIDPRLQRADSEGAVVPVITVPVTDNFLLRAVRRVVTKDKRKVVYSLRHRVHTRLREIGCPRRTQHRFWRVPAPSRCGCCRSPKPARSDRSKASACGFRRCRRSSTIPPRI